MFVQSLNRAYSVIRAIYAEFIRSNPHSDYGDFMRVKREVAEQAVSALIHKHVLTTGGMFSSHLGNIRPEHLLGHLQNIVDYHYKPLSQSHGGMEIPQISSIPKNRPTSYEQGMEVIWQSRSKKDIPFIFVTADRIAYEHLVDTLKSLRHTGDLMGSPGEFSNVEIWLVENEQIFRSD
jgi:hypothetical protein